MGWTIEVREFDSRRRLGIFPSSTASRPALGPTQPPIQWLLGALSLRLKQPRREADHSPLSSVEVKNAWRHTSTPQYVFMAWYLVKHGDNFTFTCLPETRNNCPQIPVPSVKELRIPYSRWFHRNFHYLIFLRLPITARLTEFSSFPQTFQTIAPRMHWIESRLCYRILFLSVLSDEQWTDHGCFVIRP
jgi:hypothetical protein